MIEQAVIDKVFEASSITDVVGEFVRLKKSGSNYTGLCPFHNERHPSFSVSETKGIYKCFSCGESGNVATFLMNHEKMSFPEAIEWLGKRYGIDVAHEQASPVNLKDVQDFFVSRGRYQVESYMKLRNFNPETYQFFGVGYSPLDNVIATNAKHKEILYDVGVLGKADNGYYDRFRGRITWPIHSVGGNVIGFAGRSNGNPKYLNSPQTKLYDKSRVLFNLFYAKKHIKDLDKAYVVEGYTDVMRMWEMGYKNVVATCGTALTADQCMLIKRFTDNIVLLFDGDVAGIKASDRAIDVALSQDLNVYVLTLSGQDPDEYLQSNKELPLEVDWMDYYVAGEDLNTDPAYVSILANEILKVIRVIPDEIKRVLYARKLSGILNVKEDALGRKIGVGTVETTQKEQPSALVFNERYLAWLLLCYGDVMLPFCDGGSVTVSAYILNALNEDSIEFTDPVIKLIADELKTSPKDLKHFIFHNDIRVSSLVSSMVNDDIYNKNSNDDELIRDVSHAILSLKSLYVSDIKAKIRDQIKAAQERGDMETCMTLLKKETEYHKLAMMIGKEIGRVMINNY